MAGASAKIIMTRLISRCASGPSNTSRMTVRLTITPPPALSPCSTRNTSRLSRVGDRAQPIEASDVDRDAPDDHRLAPEGVGERAVERAHQPERDEVRRHHQLHLVAGDVEVGAHLPERRERGVDAERAEHREPRQDDGDQEHEAGWQLGARLGDPDGTSGPQPVASPQTR